MLEFLAGPKERLPTLKERTSYLTSLSLLPCLICYLAFTRPAIYRFISKPDEYEGVNLQCPNFGWLNNANVNMTCDNRPLDIHATLALMWLTLFTVQVLAIKFQFHKIHKFIGKYLGIIAFLSVIGMLQMVVMDVINPMETDRPFIFTPFMFATAWIILGCLYMSFKGLAATPRNIDDHGLWMCRAFLMSFTTPVIRFYPLILRYMFSTKCMKEQGSLDTWVIESMTLAATLTLYLFWLANKACLDQPVDAFLLFFLSFEACALIMDVHQGFTNGVFFVHMYTC
jgi:hypothetical protein